MDELLDSLTENYLTNYEDYCVASPDKVKSLLKIIAKLYSDFQNNSEKPFGPFQELIIDGLDLESIWEGIYYFHILFPPPQKNTYLSITMIS